MNLNFSAPENVFNLVLVFLHGSATNSCLSKCQLLIFLATIFKKQWLKLGFEIHTYKNGNRWWYIKNILRALFSPVLGNTRNVSVLFYHLRTVDFNSRKSLVWKGSNSSFLTSGYKVPCFPRLWLVWDRDVLTTLFPHDRVEKLLIRPSGGRKG